MCTLLTYTFMPPGAKKWGSTFFFAREFAPPHFQTPGATLVDTVPCMKQILTVLVFEMTSWLSWSTSRFSRLTRWYYNGTSQYSVPASASSLSLLLRPALIFKLVRTEKYQQLAMIFSHRACGTTVLHSLHFNTQQE